MALPTLRRGGSPVPVRRADGNMQANALQRMDPWNDFEAMNRLMDSFFSSPFSSLLGHGLSRTVEQSEWPMELYETADDLKLYIYAPGMAQDSFDISASADTVTIKGERKPLLEVTEGLVSHTPWGGWATGTSTFSASYNLPIEIDPAKVEANYKDGVLHVRMPKSEVAKPRQVKVALT